MERPAELTPEEKLTSKLSELLHDYPWQKAPYDRDYGQRQCRSAELTTPIGRLTLSQFCSAEDLGNWTNGIDVVVDGRIEFITWGRDGSELKETGVSPNYVDALL